MARTIKQLINQAQGELGLSNSPAIYAAGADTTGAQMGALANRVLDELRRWKDGDGWSVMQREFNLVVNTPTITTGDMAAHSAVITNIPNTSTLSAYFWAVSGAGIPQAARILSIDSPTQVTMTMENTNTTAVTGTAITFAQDMYAMPTDIDWFNNQTMWDRTNFWKLLGPDSAQRDQWMRSGITPLTPRRHWRLVGPYPDRFRIWPPPREISSPLQLVFEYISNAAVQVAGSTTNFATTFVNDTDTSLLDEDAIIQGIKWMFWEIKGFGSYVTMQSRWVDYVNKLAARDGGAPLLNMAQRETALLISPANVQDGNFPAPPSNS